MRLARVQSLIANYQRARGDLESRKSGLIDWLKKQDEASEKVKTYQDSVDFFKEETEKYARKLRDAGIEIP